MRQLGDVVLLSRAEGSQEPQPWAAGLRETCFPLLVPREGALPSFRAQHQGDLSKPSTLPGALAPSLLGTLCHLHSQGALDRVPTLPVT